MNKLASLRAHLIQAIPGLDRDPDRLRTYVPEGTIRFHRGQHLSHEYRFTAEVILLDHNGTTDTVVVPLLQWLSHYQPDLDPETAVRFSSEVQRHDAVDLIFSMELTERVVALVNCEAGRIDSEHRMPEYPIEACPATEWQLYAKGPGEEEHELESEWSSP